MTDELTLAELDGETLELLPDRETLCWRSWQVTNVIAVNFAIAINAGGANSSANAVATQMIAVFSR